MPEEVRIIAVLDTTDIDNGVKRIKGAAEQVKAEVEGQMSGIGTQAASKSGEDAGTNFLNGFLKRLLIRDVVYGAIRFLGNIIQDAMNDMDILSGVTGKAKGGFMQRWAQGIADGMKVALATTIPSLGAAWGARGEGLLAATNAEISRQQMVDFYRENPEKLTAPTSLLKGQLAGLETQRFSAEHEYGVQQEIAQRSAQPAIAEEAKAKFDEIVKGITAQETGIKELISIAERRDRGELVGGEKTEKADFKSLLSVLTAGQFMEGEIRKQEAADAKKAEEEKKKDAAKAKREEREKLSLSLSDQESRLRPDEEALRFDERELRKQRATSAVTIHGGLYGRNDSAMALVQHATQQVSLLRSIDSELKQIRKEKQELSIL